MPFCHRRRGESEVETANEVAPRRKFHCYAAGQRSFPYPSGSQGEVQGELFDVQDR